MDFKSFFGPCRPDQFDNYLVRFQWRALPVASDVTEQAVFYLIPFARAWREMAYLDDHPGFVGEPLQLQFP